MNEKDREHGNFSVTRKKNQENQEPGPLTMIYSEELLTQSQRQSGMSIAHGT